MYMYATAASLISVHTLIWYAQWDWCCCYPWFIRVSNAYECNLLSLTYHRYDEGVADMLAGGYNGMFNNLN
jgi:hypothetical protein